MVGASGARMSRWSDADIDRARAARDRWRADPAVFSREVLGFNLWSVQRAIALAVAQHKSVAVASGHKVGKSSLAAVIALWFYVLYPRARVILTAPSNRQVEEVIWHEVKQRVRNAFVPIGGELHDTARGGLRSADGRQVFGFSTDEPDRFSGISGENVLYVVDEGAGVDETIFEALHGNRMGGAKLLMLGNPTSTTGEFFEAFHGKSSSYQTFRVSSLDTPNARAGRTIIPGLAELEMCEQSARDWGVESDAYRTRVEGKFPLQGSDRLFAIDMIENAIARCRAQTLTPDVLRRRLDVGVDVARFGDDESVITMRRGDYVYPQVVISKLDTVAVAQAARSALMGATTYRDLDMPQGHKPRIKVDAIGIGAGVADNLRAAAQGRYVVVDVNSSETAKNDPEKHDNVRTELSFALRDFLRDGGGCPDDQRLVQELKSVRYKFDVRGRYKLLSKDEIKREIKRSPDRADSLALSVYDPPESHDLSRGLWVADL